MVYFGPHAFHLIEILDVALWLDYNATQVPIQVAECGGLFHARNLHILINEDLGYTRAAHRGNADLCALFKRFHKMECKDPKDRIYALLGLLKNPPPVKPDYKKSDAIVFAEVTRQMIQESGTLDILDMRFSTAVENPPRTPSWAVRFDVPAAVCPERFAGFFKAHNGVPMSSKLFAQSKDPAILSLSGILVDEVQGVGRRLGFVQDKNMGAVLKDIQYLTRMHRSHQYYNQRLGVTLMTGRNILNEPVSARDMNDFAAYTEFLRKYRQNPPHALHHKNRGLHDDATVMASRCHSAVVYACSLRRFFMTKAGRFGVGPDGVMDGDLIAVLYGCRDPVALRYAGKGMYYYIGACYVEGIMYGEAVVNHKADKRKDDIFHIM